MGRTTVDQGRAAHESVEGETLVIDTLSGRLLIISGFGSAVWDALVEGADVERLLEEVGQRYDSGAADAVAAFVDTLRGHELLLEETAPSEDQADAAPSGQTSWPDAFVQPTVETYDEIADIMTMDPVHEVDPDLGWPHTLPQPAPLPPTPG
ncbi:MAG: PqqD family peptide modification chaperone [Acidimicrobiia bacterium]|nr:PqqD family peptide modification chaperone [Acidimicrobiia bacterium]